MKLIQDFGVRALLGTVVVVPTIGALVFLAINGSNEARTVLGTIASMVIAFYFGQRQAS